MAIDRIHIVQPVCLPISEFDYSRRYEQKINHKPKGFWYSIGDCWENWVIKNELDWISEFRYSIELGSSNILRLKTKDELLEFSKRFGKTSSYNQYYRFESVDTIDWKQVAQNWDGIEINPYVNSARLDPLTSWYYTWDVASGCVWNLSRIAVTPLQVIMPTNESKTEL